MALMADSKMTEMIGYCGDNCLLCPRYAAAQNGSAEELEKAKELWVRLGLRDPNFPAKEMVCYGCGPKIECAYSELRSCAHKKGVDTCGLCAEYPCGLISAAFDKSQKLQSRAVRVCIPKEIEMIEKAFFSKRQNLDRIHSNMNRGK
jgi:hypothetical protein